MPSPRQRVITEIAQQLAARLPGQRLRVGIDGVCGAGKTVFADELADAVTVTGRPVIRIDSDGFHHVRERRYRQGRLSARGYYEDAYDFDALAERVLRPLGPDGDGSYATQVHDLATDEIVTNQNARAPDDAVLIVDATFIQRDPLRELWDEVIYLHADEAVAIERGIARDAAALGGVDAARSAYESRYRAAWRMYVSAINPMARASIVVDHTDPVAPELIATR